MTNGQLVFQELMVACDTIKHLYETKNDEIKDKEVRRRFYAILDIALSFAKDGDDEKDDH